MENVAGPFLFGGTKMDIGYFQASFQILMDSSIPLTVQLLKNKCFYTNKRVTDKINYLR